MLHGSIINTRFECGPNEVGVGQNGAASRIVGRHGLLDQHNV